MCVWHKRHCSYACLDRQCRIDNFVLGKEFVGEDRNLDRILLRLKLHAESRQFGG
jgi:hypothetical protein